MDALLATVAPDLAQILKRPVFLSAPIFAVTDIRCEKVMVKTRDGVQLATDVYMPPRQRAPAIAVRTPYARNSDVLVGVLVSFVRRGYVVVSQDCRGTGGSEPDHWDYYVRESEDGYDLVEWISRQAWFDGFLGAFGASYDGQTQWQMAMHPRMSTIVPAASGLGVASNTVHVHMFNNAYARVIGKGKEKINAHLFELEDRIKHETLSTGYFNEPLHQPVSEVLIRRFPHVQALPPSQAQRWLWGHYCSLSCEGRAEFIKQALGVKNITSVDVESLSVIFGHTISHDRHTLPHAQMDELCKSFHTPILMTTGWYDWGLNDALATWELLMRSAPAPVRSHCRIFISPSAHNAPGYHEGFAEHPELRHAYTAGTNFELLLRWYAAVREDEIDAWPPVIYYLMGANEWRSATNWPIPEARALSLYLGSEGRLRSEIPQAVSQVDQYTYDPSDPTPTVGGSILSFVYPPGSVDVSRVQERADVLSYTTTPLEHDLDIVGPLRMVLYASSSVPDTDFAARLSDVFPDGRAIQLQNGLLRARYRNLNGEPELLEPGHIYRLEIDMWATANRFKAGHSLRVDISSADFPRFDRNTNLGGQLGPPIVANQTIYRDAQHPSHLLLFFLGRGSSR